METEQEPQLRSLREAGGRVKGPLLFLLSPLSIRSIQSHKERDLLTGSHQQEPRTVGIAEVLSRAAESRACITNKSSFSLLARFCAPERLKEDEFINWPSSFSISLLLFIGA